MSAAGAAAGDIARARDLGQRIASPAAEAAYHARTGRALTPNTPLSGLGRLSIPFRPDAGATFGSGPLAQRAAGYLDTAGDWLTYRNPIGRFVGSHFRPAVGGATGELTQRAKEAHGSPLKQELLQKARLDQYDVQSRLDQLIRAEPQHEADILRAARIIGEGGSPLSYVETGGPTRFLHDTGLAAEAGRAAASFSDNRLAEAHIAGLPITDLMDRERFIRHIPRQATAAERAGNQLERRTLTPTTSGANLRRQDIFVDLPGGTDRINVWAHQHAGSTDPATTAGHILHDLDLDHLAATGAAATPAEMAEYAVKATEIADWASGLDPTTYLGHLRTNPYFRHGLSQDVLRGGEQHARTMGGARTAVAALAQAAQQVNPANDLVPMNEALRRLGLVNRDTGTELVGAGRELYRRMAPAGAGRIEPLVVPGPGGTFGLNAELPRWGVPQEAMQEISRQHRLGQVAEESRGALRAFDSFTNSFKGLAYPLWVASHVRNAATAALNNARTGTSFGDYLRQARLMTGKLPESIANPMRREEFGFANIFGGGSGATHLQGTPGHAALPSSRLFEDFTPGTNQYGMGRMGPYGNVAADTGYLLGKEGVADLAVGAYQKLRHPRTAPNPFRMAGVGTDRATGELNKVDTFAPLIAGRKASGVIEDFFRGAQFQGLRRQGATPEQAAAGVLKHHFDYGPEGLTNFERNVATRLMPFYRFSRGNLPFQLETLATRPGAFSVPFSPTQVDRDQKEYVPNYLAGGFAMPVGKPENGNQRFISSLGLPQEEALKEAQLWNGAPDVGTTLQRYAGNLNPLIKGPLEYITGKQFYSGRNLADLRPSALGSALGHLSDEKYSGLFSQILSNTPATRFVTTLDKLADTKALSPAGRKELWATGLNLLTGARVTDVDLAKQQYLEKRAALNALLANSPHVSHYQSHYIRPEHKGELTPLETMQMRALNEMTEQAQAHMKLVRRGQQQ
jgi:hypothetical protein